MFSLPDPRTSGSNNPGATNVLRIGNKGAAAVTLIFDILKASLAIIITNWVYDSHLAICLSGISVLLGHLFPLYFKFKGGKGVATSLGIFLAINISVCLCLIITWVFVLSLIHI